MRPLEEVDSSANPYVRELSLPAAARPLPIRVWPAAQRPRGLLAAAAQAGYFIGRLGRAKVCALKRGELEIPSDFAGVVWEKMDSACGWKLALARELLATGHTVDLNNAVSIVVRKSRAKLFW